jgi:predicted esterase
MPAPKIGSEIRCSAPAGPATATVIFLHGLGDDGSGWSEQLAGQWHRRYKKFQYVNFVFPNAVNRPITIVSVHSLRHTLLVARLTLQNMGMAMPGWYDIRSLSALDSRSDDEAGIKESQKYIHDLIASEVAKGVPSERIVLGGFSQGGAMSLLSGLTAPQKLGGVVGLSCYLLLKDSFQELAAASGNANKDTKIFMGHGNMDQVVKYEFGQMTAETVKAMGYSVDFKTYK